MLLFQQEVEARIAGKPYLHPVFSHPYDIPRRLREEVDDTLFVVWNSLTKRYEVHSTAHHPDTYAWTVPFEQLDERTVRLARKNSLLTRGDRIFREIDEHNERLEQSLKRQRRNEIESWARDVAYGLFRKTAYWE